MPPSLQCPYFEFRRGIVQSWAPTQADDLTVVVNRIGLGLSESDALREWAEVAKVDGVDRLVGVLALHTEAAALGRLVTVEARQARRELHRRTIEAIERRAQQVWVPVTVATVVQPEGSQCRPPSELSTHWYSMSVCRLGRDFPSG